MPRCPDCNKFVSLDSETEPEVNVSVDKEGNVSGTVRIANSCQECSQEMSECTFEVDVSAPDEVTKHLAKGQHELEVELSASRTDRYENKTRTGKIIRNPRYQKHMYGAEGTIEWTCICNAEWSHTQDWSDEVQASGMDSLV